MEVRSVLFYTFGFLGFWDSTVHVRWKGGLSLSSTFLHPASLLSRWRDTEIQTTKQRSSSRATSHRCRVSFVIHRIKLSLSRLSKVFLACQMFLSVGNKKFTCQMFLNTSDPKVPSHRICGGFEWQFATLKPAPPRFSNFVSSLFFSPRKLYF